MSFVVLIPCCLCADACHSLACDNIMGIAAGVGLLVSLCMWDAADLRLRSHAEHAERLMAGIEYAVLG